MVIKKNIEVNDKAIERERESFISKGAKDSAYAKKKAEFTNVLIRLPTQMLEKIDERRWSTRTSWIIQAIDAQLRGWRE